MLGETEDQRLKTLQERYEDRLAGLTVRLRAVVEDIKQDEVLKAMQDDPASAQFTRSRLRELAIDRLGQEREETISRLISDLSASQSRCQHLEQAYSQAQSSLLSLQHHKPTDSTANSQPNSQLTAQITDLKQENEKTKLEFEQKLKLKSSENESLRKELETERSRNAKISLEFGSLKRINQNLEAELMRIQSSTPVKQTDELVQAQKQIATLESTVASYAREREELREKYLSYSREFKSVLATEQLTSRQALDSLHSQYKSKSTLFKKKIIEQKTKIHALEQEIEELRSDLQAAEETHVRDLDQMKTDLEMVRTEWMRKCGEVENSSAQLSQISFNNSDELQKMCRNLKNENEELHSQVNKLKLTEIELRKTLENRGNTLEKDYIRRNKHKNILSEELNKLKSALIAEKNTAETEIIAEMSKKMSALKGEYEKEMQRLTAKTKLSEENEETAIANMRKSEREREFALEKVENLTAKLANLTSELSEMENNKKALLSHLEESSSTISRLKSLYEEEISRRKLSEDQISSLRDRFRSIESENSLRNNEFQQQIYSLKRKQMEETANLQADLEKEQELSRKQMEEMRKLREELGRREEEMRVLEENYGKSVEEMRKSRVEEVMKWETAQKETRCKLEAKEAQNSSVLGQVEALQLRLTTETQLVTDLRQALQSSQSQSSQLSTELKRLEIQCNSLNNALQTSKQTHFRFRNKAKNTLKDLKNAYQTRLNTIQKTLLTDLAEFKKFLSAQVEKSLVEVEKLQRNAKQKHDLALLEKEKLVKTAEMQKIATEKLLNDTFSLKSSVYESQIDELKSALSRLKSEINDKNQEIASFLQKISDFQLEQTRISAEKVALEQELEFSRLESQEFESKIKSEEANIEEKHKNELLKLQNSVNLLEKRNLESFLRFESELKSLEITQKRELEAEKVKFREVGSELDALNGVVNRLKQEFCSQMEKLETEIGDLLRVLTMEKQKFEGFRREKTAEVEEMGRKLKKTTQDLREMEEILEKTNKEKEILRRKMKESRDLDSEKPLKVETDVGRLPQSLSQLKASLQR